MSLRLDITAEDIAKGQPGNPYGCVVALAAIRALADRNFDLISVTSHHVLGWLDTDTDQASNSWILGQEGRAVVAAVDTQRKVEPCTLYLEANK